MSELSDQDIPEVRRSLSALAEAMADEQTPTVLEERLLQKFRARSARRSIWPLWTALAAAAAVAAIVIVNLDSPVEPLPPLRLVHAGPAPQWVRRQVQASPPHASKQTVRQARRRSSPVPASDPAETEVASDFFALQPGPLVAVGEIVPMVRVRLPRYEMRRFGLPAGPEPWRTIQADVLLGQDGTARAIRFVSTRAQ